MRASPLVTIGIAVHNGARFLEDTIASIEAQDYPNLRFVVSDDASTDASLDVIHAFAQRDERVQVIAQERRLGWIGNYNALLAHAEGEYFVWMPQDDLYEPSYVSALVGLLERWPRAVVAYSGGMMIEPDGTPVGPIPVSARYGTGSTPFGRAMRFVWWAETEKARPFRGLIRTEALRKSAGLRNVRFASDGILMFELALAGEIALDPRRLYFKHVYPESVSRNYGHSLPEWLEYLDAYLDVIRDADLVDWQKGLLMAAVHLRRARLAAVWAVFPKSRSPGLSPGSARAGLERPG